jgi:hypothetical protein
MKYLVSVSFASFLLLLYFCSISDSSYTSDTDTSASICSAYATSTSLLLFSILHMLLFILITPCIIYLAVPFLSLKHIKRKINFHFSCSFLLCLFLCHYSCSQKTCRNCFISIEQRTKLWRSMLSMVVPMLYLESSHQSMCHTRQAGSQ